jgi:uncharacterized protein involved in outer membrane biogenesis
LLLVAYVGTQFFLGSVVKAGVNKVGPRITQSKVELASASLSPLSGAGTLVGLSVGNPAGWTNGNALSVGRVHFVVEPLSILHDTVVINELTVEQAEFSYETHLVSSNIGDLMNNIEASVGNKTDAPVKDAKPRKYIVRHFRLDRAKVTVGVGSAAIPLAVPQIDLTNLGVAEGGLTSGQLAFALLRQVTPNIIAATTEATAHLNGTMGAAAGNAVKRASESLQKWLGTKK